MITIFKCFMFKKSNINNLIIFLLILLFLSLIISFYISINDKQNEILNTINNRTATINLSEKYNVADIKKIDFIQKINNYSNDNSYEIIFKSYNDMINFKSNYSDYYDFILLPLVQVPPVYKVLYLLTLIFMIITLILVIIFLIFYIIDFTISNKKDISFFKLLGYTNSKIIKYLFSIYYLIYFVACIITFFVGNLTISIINNVLKISNINFVLLSLNINYLILEITIIYSIIFIVLICLYFKIKRISPIMFEIK